MYIFYVYITDEFVNVIFYIILFIKKRIIIVEHSIFVFLRKYLTPFLSFPFVFEGTGNALFVHVSGIPGEEGLPKYVMII